MARYIEATDALRVLSKYYYYRTDAERYDLAIAISNVPTADVIERRHGEWIWMGEKGDSRFMCSVCKSKENVPTCNGKPTIWWFCPNCGADMREEIENVVH